MHTRVILVNAYMCDSVERIMCYSVERIMCDSVEHIHVRLC